MDVVHLPCASRLALAVVLIPSWHDGSLSAIGAPAASFVCGSSCDLQYDLAGNTGAPLGFEGLATALEREDIADDGSELGRVDPPGQLAEGRPVGLDDEEDAARVPSPGRDGDGFDDRDEHAARLDDRPGPFLGLPTHQVEDQVDVAGRVLESLAVNVHELVCPELAHQLARRGPAGRHDVGTRAPSQLNGERPDA